MAAAAPRGLYPLPADFATATGNERLAAGLYSPAVWLQLNALAKEAAKHDPQELRAAVARITEGLASAVPRRSSPNLLGGLPALLRLVLALSELLNGPDVGKPAGATAGK